jgi:hypothetical protein
MHRIGLRQPRTAGGGGGGGRGRGGVWGGRGDQHCLADGLRRVEGRSGGRRRERGRRRTDTCAHHRLRGRGRWRTHTPHHTHRRWRRGGGAGAGAHRHSAGGTPKRGEKGRCSGGRGRGRGGGGGSRSRSGRSRCRCRCGGSRRKEGSQACAVAVAACGQVRTHCLQLRLQSGDELGRARLLVAQRTTKPNQNSRVVGCFVCRNQTPLHTHTPININTETRQGKSQRVQRTELRPCLEGRATPHVRQVARH